MSFRVTEEGIARGGSEEQCPEGATSENEAAYWIDPEKCPDGETDVGVCPVRA